MTTTIGGSYPAVNSDSDATINGLTVGKGGGAVDGNTVVGASALPSNTTGSNNTAIGNIAGYLNTTGTFNLFLGSSTGRANTSGSYNSFAGGLDSGGIPAARYNTTGSYNTAFGSAALANNTTASNNTAVGYQASYSGVTGQRNVAVGRQALYTNTANFNTALGDLSLFANTTGSQNVAVGVVALTANTTGQYNNAMGSNSLVTNTTGSNNTSIGHESLYNNTTASNNTAVGYQAGYSNTTGTENSFVGRLAGYSTTTGSYNTAFGTEALRSNTTGRNTAIGTNAGYGITTGTFNQCFGDNAGASVTTGSKNTIVGCYSGNQGGLDIRTLSNYIVLSDGDGNPRQVTNADGFLKVSNNGALLSSSGVYHEINTSRVDSYALRVGVTAASGGGFPLQLFWQSQTNNNTTDRYITCSDATSTKMQVFSNGNIQNQNGSYGTISDIKNKENIVDATPKLDKLLTLKVRNFNLKDDDTKLKQIGFIAQEFEKVFPSMIEESPDMDSEGNKTGETTKAIKTSVLIPILVKAIQELKTEVDSLKQQLGK